MNNNIGTPLNYCEDTGTKNLNLVFDRPEHINFSSILLTSDRESLNSNPEMLNHLSPKDALLCNEPMNSNNVKSKSNYSNKKLTTMLKKLKYDEILIKDIISYAGSLFDLKEYLKCTYVLKLYALPKYPTAMFLYYYSEFMIIQQKRQEELLENSDLSSKYYPSKEMSKLYLTLQQYEAELSPFCLYLYGIILKELNMMEQAHSALNRALNQFPFLWPAWVELALIVKQNEIVSPI